jgi:CopG family nickel-responsive transcriptional regulator
MKEKVVRFCVSLPQYLLEELDRKIIKRGYSSSARHASSTISSLMRSLRRLLALIYDHHQRELTQKMLEIQHREDLMR